MTDEAVLRQCNYCPKRIRWGVTNKGKSVPLDPNPVKLWIHEHEPGRRDQTEPRLRLVWGFTPHHATCTGVDQAKADARKKRDAELERRRR